MVNNSHPPVALGAAPALVRGYVAAAFATLAVLAVLAAVAPAQAGDHAWWHGAIVAGFSLLLLIRTRSAEAGRDSGRRAVLVISSVLLVANLVEAALPGTFPAWMRVEMVGVAGLMLLTIRELKRATHG
jgi:hypothetical protein